MKALVALHHPDVIGITEIKPKLPRHKVEESEIAFEGYEVFHNLDNEGRGIALFVKSELNPTPSDKLNALFTEHISVDCTQGDGTVVTFCLIYRSPNSSHENNQRLCELIKTTADRNKDDILLLGDFNLPSIDWKSETCNNNDNHVATQFLEAYSEAGLYQHQREITRHRKGEKPNTLDLVLTNKEDLIKNITTGPGLGKSDHMTLYITLNAKKPQKKLPAKFCFKKTDQKKK